MLKKGENYSLVSQDHLSSTSTTMYFGTDPVSTITYEPFGDRRISQGTIPTDNLFNGQRLDGTGLH